MDFDGEHNPNYIPMLINPILKGEADVVNSSWYMEVNGKKSHFTSSLGNTVLIMS